MKLQLTIDGIVYESAYITSEGYSYVETYYTDSLKPADDNIRLSVPYSLSLVNAIQATDDLIKAVITDGTTVSFTGYVRPDFTFSQKQSADSIALELVAPSYLLDCELTEDYYAVDKTVTYLVTKLLELATELTGTTIELSDSATSITDTVTVFSASEGDTVESILEELLFEFGYTYDFDNSGKMIINSLFNQPESVTQTFNGANTYGSISIEKKETEATLVKVTYDKTEKLSNVLIYSDTSDGDSTYKCNITVDPQSYMYGSADTELNYDSDKGDVKYVESIDTSSIEMAGSLQMTKCENKGLYAELTVYNPTSNALTVTQMDIYGVAYIATATETRATGEGSKVKEITAKYLNTSDQADALAKNLANYYKYADFTIDLTSDADYEPGTFVTVTAEKLGTYTCRIIQKVKSDARSDKWNYHLEAVDEFTPATVITKTYKLNSANYASARGVKGERGEQGPQGEKGESGTGAMYLGAQTSIPSEPSENDYFLGIGDSLFYSANLLFNKDQLTYNDEDITYNVRLEGGYIYYYSAGEWCIVTDKDDFRYLVASNDLIANNIEISPNLLARITGVATDKADAAEASAVEIAAEDATQKANAAQSAAEATASADATQKANAAQSTAISTASADATEKASAAQSAAISTAAADATEKASAAQSAAETYADGVGTTTATKVRSDLYKYVPQYLGMYKGIDISGIASPHDRDWVLCSENGDGFIAGNCYQYLGDDEKCYWSTTSLSDSGKIIQALSDALESGELDNWDNSSLLTVVQNLAAENAFITNLMAQTLTVGKTIKSGSFDGDIDSSGGIISPGENGFAIDLNGYAVFNKGLFTGANTIVKEFSFIADSERTSYVMISCPTTNFNLSFSILSSAGVLCCHWEEEINVNIREYSEKYLSYKYYHATNTTNKISKSYFAESIKRNLCYKTIDNEKIYFTDIFIPILEKELAAGYTYTIRLEYSATYKDSISYVSSIPSYPHDSVYLDKSANLFNRMPHQQLICLSFPSKTTYKDILYTIMHYIDSMFGNGAHWPTYTENMGGFGTFGASATGSIRYNGDKTVSIFDAVNTSVLLTVTDSETDTIPSSLQFAFFSYQYSESDVNKDFVSYYDY